MKKPNAQWAHKCVSGQEQTMALSLQQQTHLRLHWAEHLAFFAFVHSFEDSVEEVYPYTPKSTFYGTILADHR